MPVASAQIKELYELIEEYVGYRTGELLYKLPDTKAFKTNKSFRETAYRLMQYHERR